MKKRFDIRDLYSIDEIHSDNMLVRILAFVTIPIKYFVICCLIVAVITFVLTGFGAYVIITDIADYGYLNWWSYLCIAVDIFLVVICFKEMVIDKN